MIAEARPEVAVYYRDQPPNEFRHVRVANQGDFLLMENFARALETANDTILNARVGRDICATVMAAVDSGRSGLPVDVMGGRTPREPGTSANFRNRRTWS